MKPIVTILLPLLFCINFIQAQFSNYTVKDDRIYINVNGYYYNETYAQLNKKNYQTALEFANISVRLCPSCWHAHALLAVVYDEMGNAKKSMKELAIAKKQCKNCVEAYFELAIRKAHHGQYEEAIAIMNESYGKDSLKAKASKFYVKRGQIKYWQSDKAGWYADNHKAYQLDTNNLDALFNLVRYEVDHPKDSSLLKLLAAIAIDSSKGYYPSYILYERAGIYLDLKAYQLAIADCNALIRLQPEYANGYVIKALAEVYSANYEAALANITTALKKSPKKAWIMNNSGFIKIHLQQYEAASQDIDSALALDSSITDAYNNKGYIYFKLGGKPNLQNSIALYDKAIAIGGKNYEPYWKYREDAIAALKEE